jgi:spore coat polysaccharide biosynthesis protein SpsF (cytidylyltransferase family)
MKIGAIVQARLSSARLPGKVVLPLVGKPVLWHVLHRLQYCKKLDIIVLATSTNEEDKALKNIADSLNIPTFFGDLEDVLSRYYHAAKKYQLDTIVRITADCPMIDPGIVDEVIDGFIKGGYDCYELYGAFPDGLDTSVFSFKALEMAFKEADLLSHREHVGAGFFTRNKDRLKVGGYEKFKDKREYRWTIDEPADYKFLKMVFAELCREGEVFSYQDVFGLLKRRPELSEINSHIVRNEGFLKSLEKDKKYIAGKERRI